MTLSEGMFPACLDDNGVREQHLRGQRVNESMTYLFSYQRDFVIRCCDGG